MTLLGWESLDEALKAPLTERLVVTPLLDRDQQVGPAAIDLRLDTGFILFRRSHRGGVDPLAAAADLVEESRERVSVPFGQGLWIHPQEMVLGATLEFVRLPNHLGAEVLGRSTWGRLGLLVATAVAVHPGYAGSLTLELVNTSNSALKVYPGLRVAQLIVQRLERPTEHGYASGPYPQYAASTRAQEAKRPWTNDEMKRVEAIGVRLSGT